MICFLLYNKYRKTYFPMQHPNPTVGNNPFLANNTGFGNKKAPSWLEKGAKNDHPYMRMKVEPILDTTGLYFK
jgi:hypothetical protein